MTSLETATADGSDKTAPAPVGMVAHLKYLIESLPVCVMRTDLEGCLLAANDSALHLLGVTEHATVLTKSLTERVSAEHADDWRAFLLRGWSEGASSVECELVDFTGAHRIILIKAVAQPVHADGIQSLILTATDLASRRRLERALNEHQGCATTIDALHSELQRSETERQRIVALLETLQSNAGDKPAEPESVSEALKQQIAELRDAFAAKEQEWHTRHDELIAQVAQHDGEREHLANLLAQRLSEQQRVSETAAERDAEHQATSDTLRARLEELERSFATDDQEWQKRCDDLTAQLAERAAERQKHSSLLEERDAERQRLSELLEQREAEHNQLSGMLEQRIADYQAAGEALKQRIGELERSLKANEQTWQKCFDELTTQLTEVSAERQRLTNLLEQRQTDHRTDGDTLQLRIAELERTLKANEEEWHQRRAELSAQLAAHVAEHARLSAVLKQRDDEIQRLSKSLKSGDEEYQRLSESLRRRDAAYQLQSELLKQREDECQRQTELLAQHEREQQRLSDVLKQHASEQERLTALLKQRDGEHQTAVEALQQQIVECERALMASDETWKQRCEELSSELTGKDQERKARWDELSAQIVEHSTERQRLSELLKHREAEQRRLNDEHAAEKIRIEQTVRSECERTLGEVDGARRREIERLRQEMGQLAEDLQRTAEQLAQRTAEYERLTAEMHAVTPEAMDPDDVQRLMRSVAAYRIELVQVTENTIRKLEPMATAGRVAIASSHELQAAVEAVDARSKQLLAQCGLGDVNRPEIERLRRDSISAASLVRQLVQVFGDSTRSRTGGSEPVGEIS